MQLPATIAQLEELDAGTAGRLLPPQPGDPRAHAQLAQRALHRLDLAHVVVALQAVAAGLPQLAEARLHPRDADLRAEHLQVQAEALANARAAVPEVVNSQSSTLLFITTAHIFARFISIWIPSIVVPFKPRLSRGTLKMLVWGGLRGGVSIALALSVNEPEYKELILEMTYFVVVFSIFVQGLTIGKVSQRVLKPGEH